MFEDILSWVVGSAVGIASAVAIIAGAGAGQPSWMVGLVLAGVLGVGSMIGAFLTPSLIKRYASLISVLLAEVALVVLHSRYG